MGAGAARLGPAAHHRRRPAIELHLPPVSAALAGDVRRIATLGHEPFVPELDGPGVERSAVADGLVAQAKAFTGGLLQERFEPRAPLVQRSWSEIVFAVAEQVERHV